MVYRIRSVGAFYHPLMLYCFSMVDKYSHLAPQRNHYHKVRRNGHNAQCVNTLGVLKASWQTRREADEKAREFALRAYKCGICGLFHLTKKNVSR